MAAMTCAGYKRTCPGARNKAPSTLPNPAPLIILRRVNRLTRQEILFILTVAGLLLTGLLVKYYRSAHPAGSAVTENNHARD
jgi:hypothetical protein